MIPADNALDLSILLDVARGFLGLTSEAAVVRHAVLSFMGAGGSRAVACFRVSEISGRLTDARGFADMPPNVALGRKVIKLLDGDGKPVPRSRFRSLDPAAHRFAADHGIQLIIPIRGDASSFMMIGPRLLQDEFSDAELDLMDEIARLMEAAMKVTTGPEFPAATAPNRTLKRLREQYPGLDSLAGSSIVMRSLFDEVVELADHDLPVLVTGETGTGKELLARALHECGPRSDEPFEAINCAAIPRDLVASALFGHERGAFTGAIAAARGAFERAGRGTLFLDEIGDMSLETQAVLLRVLQGRLFQAVGSEKSRPVMARIVSATNRDLARAAREGSFRPDLFYRVQIYTITVPPLRDRIGDIPEIVAKILGTPAGRNKKASTGFLRELRQRSFPGNVRELEGLVLGAVVRSRRRMELVPEDLPRETADKGLGKNVSVDPESGTVHSYEDMERTYVRSILRLTGGNRVQAAALMKIPRTTLNARLKKLGLATGMTESGQID